MADAESVIEQAVLEVLKQKGQRRNEDRQDYLRRLAGKANGVWFARDNTGADIEPTEEAEKAWEELTEPTQKWINEVVLLVDSDNEMPDFPDRGEEDETQTNDEKDDDMTLKDEDKERDAETSRKSAKKGNAKGAKAPAKAAAKKGAAKPAPKEAKKPAAAKSKGGGGERKRPGGVSGYTAIRAIMMKDLSTKLPDLIEQLSKKGYDLSQNAVGVIRANFVQTCRELQKAGCLKNIKVPE